MLIVISRVTSRDRAHVERRGCARRGAAVSARSAGRVRADRRAARVSQQRSEHVGQPGRATRSTPAMASASFFDHFAISSYVRAGSSS